MSPLLAGVAAALPVLLVGAVWVLHGRGYRVGDFRPTFDWDRWHRWKARLRRPAGHRPGSPRPGSRFADLQVRAPLHHHETQGLTADQIARILAEGRRDEDGAP